MNDSDNKKKTLLLGIGNYGRSDDALGWQFIDAFSGESELFDFEYRYQLQIEDADLVSRYENVIFVDASRQPLDSGFLFYPCTPVPTTAFTTHQLNPETILWLAEELYEGQPTAFVMAIEGSQWELHHGLSEQASRNFEKAVSFFKEYVQYLMAISV